MRPFGPPGTQSQLRCPLQEMRREILAQGTKTPRSFLSFRHSWIQGLKPCHPGLLFHFLQNSDRLLTIVRQPLTSSYIAWYPAFVFCYSIVVVVQPLSPVQLFVTSWTTSYQTSVSFTVSWSLLMSGVQWIELENGMIVRSKGKGRIKLDSYVSNFVDLKERYI